MGNTTIQTQSFRAVDVGQRQRYIIPFALLCSLFFLWAVANNLNDILLPQFQQAFTLTNFQAGLIQSAFYFGYFVIPIPAGILMKKLSYKAGIITGLFLYAFGAALFWPAAEIMNYTLFLIGLFIIAAGLGCLETAANPFVTVLGPESGGHFRLNLAQTFNSFGAIIAVVVAVLLVALGASGFMLLNSAKTVKSEAKEAVEIVGGLKDKVTSGDFSTLPDDAKKIDELCNSMKAETSSPLWTAASFIPVYGSDINAARTMIDALSDVSSNALVPMADNLSQATPGKLFQDGMINVSALQAVADSLSSSSKVFKSANEKVQGIGDTHISQVTELVDKAKDGFATLNGAVDAAEKVAPVLPQMLGANGQTRNYLMYAMNNVEIRACGGFGGSQGLISVTDGQMSIGEFVPRIGLSEDEAVESVDEEDEALFGNHSNLYNSGNTYSPDWPRNSQRVAALWKSQYGQDVDGVIGIDPVFLQYLLGLVGNVSLPDGTVVDGTNAAKVLMHDVYWNYPVEESDGIFASVASAAFDKVLGGIGDVDVTKLVSAVERGAEEGRLIAWMRNDDEQNAIKETGIDASLPDPDDPSADPVAGVYFNNLSFSKLDWYLNADTQIGQGVKNGDGTCSYHITVTLTNIMTQEEAGKLPDYVAASAPDAARDDERLNVSLFAPTGGNISDLTVEGTQFGLGAATWHGIPFYSGTVDLHAGETTTITYTLTTSAEAGDKPLTLRQTPTCQAARDSASA